MVAAGHSGWTPERSAAGAHSPWLIATIISIATFMEVLDASIANVALRHIAGSLSASYDESTWILTAYLIANAVILPISGWLSDVIGRKRYYMLSVALFAASSLLCGLAPSLGFLIVARIAQGLGGGGLATSEQSMLTDTFPPEKRGQAFAIYGLTVIFAPIVGPTIGGLITDQASWHWIFLINVPIGLLSLTLVALFVDEPEALARDRAERFRGGLSVDYVGFLLIALGLGSLEIVLDRGQRDDWFASAMITSFTIVSAAAIVTLVIWELRREDPIVHLRLLGRRNFGIANLMMATTGAIVFGSTQFIPQLLQEVLGYTATLAGEAMTAGGIVTLFLMPLTGLLSNKVQPRILIGLALVIEVFAFWHMAHLNAQMDFWDAAWARLYQAVGLPFLFIPISAVAYVGLRPEESNQAASLLNVSRNLGGTIGIAVVQTLLAEREQFHQARLVERLNPLEPSYQEGLARMTRTLIEHGQSAIAAQQLALGQLYRTIVTQATMLAFIDAIWVLMIGIIVILPTVFLLRTGKPGAAHGAA
jgi:MFS transporter, DHA2 family, multidrug resistance protein